MKKGILLGLASLFVLTGCGNKVVCTGKMDEAGMKAEVKITATIKADKVDKIAADMTFDDEKTAKSYCGLFELANSFAEKEEDKISFDCKGKTISFKDYSKMVDEDADSDNKVIGMKKADFIKEMEKEDGVKCK